MTVSGTSDGVGQISATTSAHSSTALSLVGPVKSSHLSIGVTARTTALVLNVVGATIATIAGGVVVLATETETGGTLRHLSQETSRMFVTMTDRLFWFVEFFSSLRRIREMNDDNDEDISSVMRQRTSREEVRRRNREIMEKANAELRDGKSGTQSTGLLPGARKEVSRFSLIKQSREGSQTFWAPYQFHNITPELIFGPLKADLDLDISKFAEFNHESFRSLFADCIKNTCLVDPASITFIDLVNPEESLESNSSWIDPLDEPLLTNELVASATDGVSGDTMYTGHFLRKPQLMSNDLFTEGNRNVGAMGNRFAVHRGSRDTADGDFDYVRAFDAKARMGEKVFNAISKSDMRPKRVLSVLPDTTAADLLQFKFDDKSVNSEMLKCILDKNLNLFEDPSMVLENSDGFDFPKAFNKRRRYARVNKSMPGSVRDDFYLMTVPISDDRVAFIKAVGNKILLKKDASSTGGSLKLKVDIAQSPSSDAVNA